ncbi:MAG: hypothetical protein QG614_540 [Patescibacteria group bacterium]|nr:hypothetical protein [Patescibacteria group bacterium]
MLNTLTSLIIGTGSILVLISGLMMTLAFIAFLLTVINFILKRNQGNADGMKQAGNMLWWSVFALFVMVAVWGISYFLAANLGIGIGGCSPKPSPVPGQVVQDNCTGVVGRSTTDYVVGSTSCASSSGRPNGCTCNISSQCSSGSCSFGSCSSSSNNSNGGSITGNTVSSSGSGSNCFNGAGAVDANGIVLYCNNGIVGEPCKSGSCATNLSCDITDNTFSQYGSCKAN